MKMYKGHLYRLQQIHEIEKQIHFEKIKQKSVAKKYYRVINFCHVCFILVQFCMFMLNVGFLANFQEIIGNISEKILQGLNLIFGSVSIFLNVIEKHLFKEIQKHEKQKTLRAKSTRFETWYRKRCQTMKFVKVSLKKSFLKQKSIGRKFKHIESLKKWFGN